VVPEVSFSIFGERGVIDVLAWHAATRTILVIELKTVIADVNELIGNVDRKRRLAPRVAAERGWDARDRLLGDRRRGSSQSPPPGRARRRPAGRLPGRWPRRPIVVAPARPTHRCALLLATPRWCRNDPADPERGAAARSACGSMLGR
jgi:hypothetical protein